ncbi:MAG: hypothetical protein ACREP9_14165 [Candidatus Dormibacteraceae bacterium]
MNENDAAWRREEADRITALENKIRREAEYRYVTGKKREFPKKQSDDNKGGDGIIIQKKQ